MSVPYTRSLDYVLRDRLGRSQGLRQFIAPVAGIPDDTHVTIDQGGVQVTIPRLRSYTPVVGEGAFCLADRASIIAIGSLAAGPTGGTSFNGNWRWDNTAPPAVGDVAINAATWAAATIVYVSNTTDPGADATNYLAALTAGDGIYIQDQDDSTIFGRYQLTAAGTPVGSYTQFPVTLVSSGGGLPNNNAVCLVTLLVR